MNAPALFAECVLPGCRAPVVDGGEPCDDCRSAFGGMLRSTTGPALTAEQVAARDDAVRDAYRAQLELVTTADRRLAIDQGEAKKPNQTCWMCEERRSCTKTRQGWECDDCRGIA